MSDPFFLKHSGAKSEAAAVGSLEHYRSLNSDYS